MKISQKFVGFGRLYHFHMVLSLISISTDMFQVMIQVTFD